jgi:hypothetical protein
MHKQVRGGALLVLAAGLLAALLAGCGNDASAEAFIPGATPTAVGLRQLTTPAPTATAIPPGA